MVTIRGSAVWVAVTLLALPVPPVAGSAPEPGQGPGDVRDGYERDDYETRSTSLAARRGTPTELLRVIDEPPLGLPPVSAPVGNPVTRDKVQLGRKLFFDRRLSANNTISCAMCHVPEQGFAQNELRNPAGIEGRSVRRNAPTIYNAAYLNHVFHDGRETSLENQVWAPLLAANEMGNVSIGAVIERIRRLDDYADRFEDAFGRGVDMLTVGMAIASYERVLVSGNSAFDRWYYGGDESALGGVARRGFALFRGKAGCVACHTIGEEYALFTDGEFHNTGVGYQASMRPADSRLDVFLAPGVSRRVETDLARTTGMRTFSDLGRYEVTGEPRDRWRYRTPTLRNVTLTSPYMHDGSLATLRDVVLFYDRGGVPNEELDPLIAPLQLSESDVEALIAFLEGLTGSNVGELVSDAQAAPIGGG